MKWIDPIVQEVRIAREKLWLDCNCDLDQLCRLLKEKQKSHNLKIIVKPKASKKHKSLLQNYHTTRG